MASEPFIIFNLLQVSINILQQKQIPFESGIQPRARWRHSISHPVAIYMIEQWVSWYLNTNSYNHINTNQEETW